MKTSFALLLPLLALSLAPARAHACPASLEHCATIVAVSGTPDLGDRLVADAGNPADADSPLNPANPASPFRLLADASTPAPSSTLEPVSTATPVPAPTSVGDDVGLLPTIAKDFAAGGPGTLLAVGLVLLVIVQLLKQYGGSLGIPAAYLPWLAIALGVLAGAGLSLASGAPLVPSLASGLVAGLASVGKYEAVASHVLPSASDVAAKPAS